MKEVIKKHKGKITMGTMTAIAALVLLLLNIYEKAEAIIARATPSSDKIVYQHNYNMGNDFSQSLPEKSKPKSGTISEPNPPVLDGIFYE